MNLTDFPIYKKELLTLGNPNSSTGLCTLWSDKGKILEKISKENYLVAGNCYSINEGINLIIRHSLINKKIHRIVIAGSDLSKSGEALIALKKNGVGPDRKVIGFPNLIIEQEIPFSAVLRFRQNVDIIDKRSIRDYLELNDFLSSLPNKEPWGESEIYERSAPKTPEMFPSERTGFVVREEKVGDAWIKLLEIIMRFGYKKKSQHSDDQIELIGMTSIITNEDPKNIDWKDYFQFTREHFNDYLPQLMGSEIPSDVKYTYGSKLRNFGGINQIDAMAESLKEALFSRRAVAVTWNVLEDYKNPNCPCLNLIQALVEDKLYLTAYIRSNDMFRAWPENALALLFIQQELCEKLGVLKGDLIIVSNSAHIYSANWDDARKIIENNPQKNEWELSNGKRTPDLRGNILIDVENGKIKITHLSPTGERIEEFYANNSLEAYREICKKQMISQISHALDIGVELGKAEIALKEGRNYVQDKELGK
ncbi:MAG: thymidylate synthase [Candidatus Nanoarchaeia archaeon]|jgi:thymidylate synthase (methanogen type)